MSRKREVDVTVHPSSGNVFADLDLPASQEDMIKIGIAHAITLTIRKRNLTQAKAGEIMGVDQARVSELLRGRVAGFSVERMMGFLIKLGRDVKITISREHANREGRVTLKTAAA